MSPFLPSVWDRTRRNACGRTFETSNDTAPMHAARMQHACSTHVARMWHVNSSHVTTRNMPTAYTLALRRHTVILKARRCAGPFSAVRCGAVRIHMHACAGRMSFLTAFSDAVWKDPSHYLSRGGDAQDRSVWIDPYYHGSWLRSAWRKDYHDVRAQDPHHEARAQSGQMSAGSTFCFWSKPTADAEARDGTDPRGRIGKKRPR